MSCPCAGETVPESPEARLSAFIIPGTAIADAAAYQVSIPSLGLSCIIEVADANNEVVMGTFTVSGNVNIDANTVEVTIAAEKLSADVDWAADGKSVTVTFNRAVTATDEFQVCDATNSYTAFNTRSEWSDDKTSVTIRVLGTDTFATGDIVQTGGVALTDSYGTSIAAYTNLDTKA